MTETIAVIVEANASAGTEADTRLQPDNLAEASFQSYAQKRSPWTHELDLRSWKGRF
jgi:hypothetical protein